MVRLLIARHGNTFDKGEIIRRVGRGTDLPLSKSGREQAAQLGKYLQQTHPDICAVFTSNLQRTIETAQIALTAMHSTLKPIATDIFDEIDYGVDEGKAETEVIARLGETALKKWDQDNVVPNGWNVDPETITKNWHEFAQEIQQKYHNKTVLVVTSNGTARFAPEHQIKLSTAAVSMLTIEGDQWHAEYLNHKP